MEASNAKLSEETKEREDKAIILIKICRLFYQNSIDSEEHLSEYNLKLYDSTCIIVFTRLLHLSHLKPIGKTFVQSLPRIPSDVLKLLELMMLTGSKGSDTKSSIVQSPRNESMLMVGNILTGLDVEASQMALNSLLWQAVSTDFEIRSRFAAYLVR